MSRVNPYTSLPKRTFENALLHLLETEYGFLGGRRILGLLIEDVQRLHQEFYPTTDLATSGTLIWTCTADEGKKAEAGKPTEAYKTATVRLPLVTVEDLHQRSTARPDEKLTAHEREKAQVARLIKSAAEQKGLLTLAEVSMIVNRSCALVARYVQEWQHKTGELLPLKGYRMDQGSSPSHKREIVRLYEEGLEPPAIAREAGHSLKSVERYLKDYERVKLLLKRGTSVEDISALIGRGRKVVLEYEQIARQYHPRLFPKAKNG
jgi:transposase-like protein